MSLALTPRSPQKPRRDEWVTLMFILMHLSPHSSGIKSEKAKREKKKKVWSLSIRRAPYIHLQLVANTSHCQTVLGGREQSRPAEPWELSPGGSRGLSRCSDRERNVGWYRLCLLFIYYSNNSSLARYQSSYKPFILHRIIQVSILLYVVKLLIEFPVSRLDD